MRAKFFGPLLFVLAVTLSACSGDNPTRPTTTPQQTSPVATAPPSGATANQTPVASFTAPAAGATLAGRMSAATCAVAASDGDGAVDRVEFTLAGKDVRATFPGVRSDAVFLCP